MKDLTHYIHLMEVANGDIKQNPLTFGKGDLHPVMSKETLDYHYTGLASKYFDRYNASEGDPKFHYGGATLHNLFFGNLKTPGGSNKPTGTGKELIEKKYGSFEKFKEAVEKTAMSIQGSGWVYMDNTGKISIIPNHEYKKGMKIMLLIDWWEHAWALDYQQDKAKYLDNIWRIVDWNVVNDRLTGE
jgi:Fe-Mn family superoxide dismutase